MRRHLGASAVGLAVAGLLVAAPPSGAGLLGGDTGLNIGGRAGAIGGVVGSVTGGGSAGLGGTVNAATSAVTSAAGGGSGAGTGLGTVTSTVNSLTGGGGSGLVSGLTGGAPGGMLATLTTTLNSALSATGLTGLTGLVGAAGLTAGTYQPPLNDIGNPHGEGTLATVQLGTGVLPSVPRLNNEVVVGRAIGEYQATTTKQFHGHITILSLFGSEIFGVDSTQGQTNSGLLGNGTSAINTLCADSAGTICLNVLKATSATTNTSSVNHFEATGVGIAGITADAAYSDGNIAVDPVAGCETSFGDAHLGNVKIGPSQVATAVNSQSGATTCNDPLKSVAPSSLSQVVALANSPLGIPVLAPAPGCSGGGPTGTGLFAGGSGIANTDAGIPLLLPLICNADDTNGSTGGKQDSIPYTVREALTAFALQLTPATALAKVTLSAAQASASAPGAIGTTTSTTTTTGTTTATTGTTTATTGTTTATTGTTTATTATTATTGTTTATTGTTTATTGTTTATTATTATTGTTTATTGTTSTGTTTTSTGTTGTTTAAVTTKSAELPFTGLNVLWLLVGGVTMLVAGTTFRRFGSRRHSTE